MRTRLRQWPRMIPQPPNPRSGPRGRTTLALEDSMTALKSLMIVSALLVGGTGLGAAQNGPPTGGQPPITGGAAGNPATPGSAVSPVRTTRHHHGTRHHR